MSSLFQKNSVICGMLSSGLLLLTVGSPIAGENGHNLFLRHCSQCHGIEGQGFRRLYPPLNGSVYFSEKLSSLPCLIRKGLRGDIQLPGNRFNQTMPANPQLQPVQLTQLMRYTARFAETSISPPFTETEVRRWLEHCP